MGPGIAAASDADESTGRWPWSRSTDTADDPASAPVLDFIPVELLGPVVVISSAPSPAADEAAEPVASPLPQLAADADDSWAERTSLFGEPEA